MKDVKLLIISNNSLSTHNSNGRTLLTLVGSFPREKLFQVYTSGELSSFRYCADFLRLTNEDVIKTWFFKKPVNNQTPPQGKTVDVNMGSKKSALTMLLRDLVWNHSPLLKRYVIDWAKQKKPDAVLLHLGDNTLMIRLALAVTAALDIPLITYYTENYYFKDYDYIKKEFKAGLLYKIYHRRFCRCFDNLMRRQPTCVYNCEGLKKLYDEQFGTQSHVVFPSTDVEKAEQSAGVGIIYAGNLGVGRHKALLEIADALQQINPQLVLDVYGRANEEVARAFEGAKGLKHHGFIDYEENLTLIKNAKLLIQVESFDPFFAVDTKYAFSTKIADYCATGNPIFVYAPEGCESLEFMRNYQAGFFCTQKADLKPILQSALTNEAQRRTCAQRALLLSEEKNNSRNNCELFKEIVISTLKKGM